MRRGWAEGVSLAVLTFLLGAAPYKGMGYWVGRLGAEGLVFLSFWRAEERRLVLLKMKSFGWPLFGGWEVGLSLECRIVDWM